VRTRVGAWVSDKAQFSTTYKRRLDLNVFLVKHAHSIEGAENDVFETKIIGIFSSELKAQEAVNSLKNQPGFVDYPNDFSVEDYAIDLIEWDGGFIRGE
jgi:hypothetical protein